MKVRHKSGLELEVDPADEVFARRGEAYRRTKGGSFINTSDPNWQLVPEEEWEDITSECSWTRQCYDSWYIQAANGDRVEAFMNGPYRVRKIDGLHHGPAFIVEKRKERP